MRFGIFVRIEECELSAGSVQGDELAYCTRCARSSIKAGETLSARAYESADVFPVRVVDDRIDVCNDLLD